MISCGCAAVAAGPDGLAATVADGTGEAVRTGVGAPVGVVVGGAADATGPPEADLGSWLPMNVPIPNPTIAAAPRMTARTGPWPILAAVAWADTGSYFERKYASSLVLLLKVPTISVDPSTVWMNTR